MGTTGPQTAIITSVEFDHGDIYRDLQHVKEAFAKFVCMIPPTGYLVACADYDNVLEVIEPGVCQVETYGYSSDADVRIVDLELSPQGASLYLDERRKGNLPFEKSHVGQAQRRKRHSGSTGGHAPWSHR